MESCESQSGLQLGCSRSKKMEGFRFPAFSSSQAWADSESIVQTRDLFLYLTVTDGDGPAGRQEAQSEEE